MIALGTVRPGSTIEIPFETFAGSTGAPITMTGLAASTTNIKVYKDGSTTERASASGYALLDTDGIDLDGLTGIHGFTIDLSDNTTADFWASGSRYTVVVTALTVDSQTVRFVAATFRIGHVGAVLDTTIATLASQTSFTLAAGSADDDAYNGCSLVCYDAASAVQMCIGVIEDYTGSTKTVTLAASPGVFTMAAKDNIAILPRALQATVPGRTLDVSTGGEAGVDWANVGTPSSTVGLSGTTVATVTTTTTATNLTNAPTNGDLTATMKTSVTTAATAATPTAAAVTGAVGSVTGNVGGNVVGSVASVAGAVGSVTGNVGGNVTGSVGSVATGGITAASLAADAITAAKVASDVAAEIADAVWDEAISGHAGAGSTGEALSAAGSAGDPWTTPLPGAYGAGTAGKIVGDNINATISSRLASASYTAPLDAAGTRSAVGLASANLDTQLDALPTAAENQSGMATAANLATVASYIDTEVAAIKAVTDAIGATGTGLSAIPWNPAWDAEVQSEAADALTAYDPPTKAELDSAVAPLATSANVSAVETDTQDIQTRLPAALVSGRMDSSVGAFPLVIDTGKTGAAVLKDLLAQATGDIAKSGNAYAFKDRDGTTLFTLTLATSARTRS